MVKRKNINYQYEEWKGSVITDPTGVKMLRFF